MSGIDIVLPNLTKQLEALNNFTKVPTNLSNIQQAGWFYPVYALYSPIQDIAWLLLIAFTLGIVYIRTNSLPAMAFVTLLLCGLVITFVPSLGAKIAYIIAIFTIAGTLWIIFGRR